MDIQLPPETELIRYIEFPIPCETPAVTIEKFHSLGANNDLQGFQSALNSEVFQIVDLHGVIMEAIQREQSEFVSALLIHGFTITPSYTRRATICKAKGVLERFLEAGWDINEPVDTLQPPVLW